jgi:hypothetical protein
MTANIVSKLSISAKSSGMRMSEAAKGAGAA